MEESAADYSLDRDLYSGSATSEESGWTLYFDDFLASRKKELNASSTSFSISSITSSPSDAASHVSRKSTVKAELSLKKRKVKGVSFLKDDSLEDTACSPINSPKVGGMEEDGKDVSRINKEKRVDSEKGGLDYMESTCECRELKKRRLRLVPLSMFVGFLSRRFT